MSAADRPRVRPGPKPGRRGPVPVTREVTEAQAGVVTLLARAYEADVAVEVETKTRWRGDDVDAAASRTVARGVVAHGLARYSEPSGRFLLLTERGKAFAGVGLTPATVVS